MRTQTAIRADIEAARKDYEAAVATKPAHEVRPHSQRVKALQAELSDFLSAGSEPCEKCSGKPVGLRHVRARGTGRVAEGKQMVVFFSHAYEVGCPACGDKRAMATTPEELSGPDLDQYEADTIARAVKKWNDEQYLPSAKR